MTTRREFLQGAAASALPVIAAASSRGGAPASAPAGRAVRAVLIDARHAEARGIGARLARSGVSVQAIPAGDITNIWLDRIAPVWKHEPIAIAGLTERPALFCLEQLAWSFNLRVAFHGEHVLHAGGQTEHRLLRGAAPANLAAPELQRAGLRWPNRIADAIENYREPVRAMRRGPSEAALGPTLPHRARLLTSWIIAPA